MDFRRRKFCVIVIKILKWILHPFSRVRKLSRKSNIKRSLLQYAATILLIGIILVKIVVYYCGYANKDITHIDLSVKSTDKSNEDEERPFKHVPLNNIFGSYKNTNESSELMDEHRQVYMIDTPGCKIPIKLVNYRNDMKNDKRSTCPNRAVYLSRDREGYIRVYIDAKYMKEYLSKTSNYTCCYQYTSGNVRLPNTDKSFVSRGCKHIKHGSVFELESDYVIVKCYGHDENTTAYLIYDDIYAFTKKISKPSVSTSNQRCAHSYNVLMIGMDSMSLNRIGQTMPRTINYFKDNFWIAFRGYHKIEDNSLPNIMAVLTGKNFSTISKQCSWRMDQCKDLFIWNKFKEDGYVTAYGEDYLMLPDTFSKVYRFRKPPTDHYLRPFLLNREVESNNGSLVCAGKRTSGSQVLNYAVDFADTYRRNKFFGLFWLNSFSHNENSRPQDADEIVENFFNDLTYTGILSNTFLIFFSDHGIRFGKYRMQMESYYDDRMPFLFISVPLYFTEKYITKYYSLMLNEFRLTTPYDLFSTLMEIKSISSCKNETEGDTNLPARQSLFDRVSKNRTCADVGIDDKWCSCHNLYSLPVQDNEGKRCVNHVISKMNLMIEGIKTRRCWRCVKIELDKIIRVNFYYSNDKESLFFVVAFTVNPGKVSYEATLLRKNNNLNIVGPISIISSYNGLGTCTMNYKDRLYCLCQKIEKCSWG